MKISYLTAASRIHGFLVDKGLLKSLLIGYMYGMDFEHDLAEIICAAVEEELDETSSPGMRDTGQSGSI